jgi:hypothetical protein
MNNFKNKFFQLVGKTKVFSLEKENPFFESGYIENKLKHGFWKQNLACTKLAIYQYESKDNEIIVDVNRQNRLKYLLLGETKHIEKNVLNHKLSQEENVEKISSYIAELNKKGLIRSTGRKMVIYQKYVYVTLIFYLTMFYVWWNYWDKIKKFIENNKTLSSIVVGLVIAKKIGWGIVYVYLLSKRGVFKYKLKKQSILNNYFI